MNELTLIPVAHARPALPKTVAAAEPAVAENTAAVSEETAAETHEGTVAETGEAAHSEGLKIDPAVVGFQALNFLILLMLLHFILFKPILKLLAEREKKIADGVENAEKADQMLKESNMIRQDMIKTANAESQSMMEKARKDSESVKNSMLADAHAEADKIVKGGHAIVEMEKAKVAQELKAKAVNMVIAATEKVLRSKMNAESDSKMIEESLKSHSA